MGFQPRPSNHWEKIALCILTESENVSLIISLACLQHFRDLWWTVTWHFSARNVCAPSKCKGEWLRGRVAVRKHLGHQDIKSEITNNETKMCKCATLVEPNVVFCTHAKLTGCLLFNNSVTGCLCWCFHWSGAYLLGVLGFRFLPSQ